MEIEELIALDQDLARLELLQSKAPILSYRPNLNQAPFHASTATGRICTGSNRSGKTAGSVVEAIGASMGFRPWLPKDHPKHLVRLGSGKPMPVPNVGRIFCEEFKTVEETILPSIRDWAPPDYIKQVKKGQRGYPERIDWANGSTTYLRVYQQDVESQEGSRAHWAMFDEPPPYDLFVAARRGLIDFHGKWWMALTPLSEPWIWDILVAKSGPSNPIEHFSYSIYNNGPPYGPMTEAAINEFIADLSPDEYESRILGNPRYLVGRVYPEWKPEDPYYLSPFRIPPFWPRYTCIDPHPRKPVAVLWLAHDPESDTVIAYDELWDNRLRTIKDVAEAMLQKEYNHRKRYDDFERESVQVVLRIIDDSAEELERGTGTTIRQEFDRWGIHTTKAFKRNKWAGYDKIHDALRISPITRRPTLQVFTTCQQTCQNFLKHVYDEWAMSKDRDRKGQKQDVRATDDDFIACIRYFYQRGMANADVPQVLQRQPWMSQPDPIERKFAGLWTG